MSLSEGGAVCGNAARTDLCGGWRVTVIPTATPNDDPNDIFRAIFDTQRTPMRNYFHLVLGEEGAIRMNGPFYGYCYYRQGGHAVQLFVTGQPPSTPGWQLVATGGHWVGSTQ